MVRKKKKLLLNYNKLSFNLIKNKDLLMLWNPDDWKNLIEVGNQLKCMQFEKLNQIFIEKQRNKRINK